MTTTISVSPDDVRRALGEGGNLDDYPDIELQFPITQAEAIVNDELAPHSDRTSRLELTGALLAAAYVEEDGAISSLSQGDRSIKFDTETALSLFRQAKQMDPTGRLPSLEAGDSWVMTT